MSLVGTRPILQDELRQYELHHRRNMMVVKISITPRMFLSASLTLFTHLAP